MPKKREFDPILLSSLKNQFENNMRMTGKRTATFEEWFSLFGSDCNNFSQIGRQLDYTRERVRQIFKQYFAPLFSTRPNGRKREKLCTLKRRAVRVKNLLGQLPDTGITKEIAEIAKAKGCNVELIIQKNLSILRPHTLKWKLKINERICSLHAINAHRQRATQKYGQVGILKSVVQSCDFYVIAENLPDSATRIYILPSAKLLTFLGDKEVRYMYFRLNENTIRHGNYRKSFDPSIYRDAWHLLKA